MVPERLADSPHLAEIREYSMRGMPIYAECGGFMVLCQELQINGKQYPMTGIFPARAEFCPRPQGLGYVEDTVAAENPFHPVGALLRGHEFHYSRCVALGELEPTLRLSPGVGMSGPGHRAKGLAAEGPDNLKSRDGLLIRNTFAAYAPLCSSRPALGRPLRRRLSEKCLIPREGGVSSKSHTPPSPEPSFPRASSYPHLRFRDPL